MFGFGAGIFFVSYALFELPSNLILARVGARLWIARIMITWGVLSVAMMFVKGPTSFYVLRFLLGLAEAGFLPGIIYYLGNWFPRRTRARAVSWFMLGIPLSMVFGGPLGGLSWARRLARARTAGNGCSCSKGCRRCCSASSCLFYLTDDAPEARWLTPEQREWLAATLRAEQSSGRARHGLSFGSALVHPTVWLLCLILFACQTGSYGLQFWVPQIVQGHGRASRTSRSG